MVEKYVRVRVIVTKRRALIVGVVLKYVNRVKVPIINFFHAKKLICDLIGHVFHNNDLDVMENEMYDMLVELEETLRKLLRRVAKNDDVLKISDNIIRF